MHTYFKNKTLGYGVGTFLPSTTKNVFRQDLINQDLEMVWTELEINARRVLIGNIYIPPNKMEQIHVLDRFLEDQRDKAIIILGDFNARNTLWDKHTNQSNKMGIVLEELIQRHSFYVATDLDHTYQHSPNRHNSGKSTIDLTLFRGINNLTVKTKEISNIKTRQKAIEIEIRKLSEKSISHTPHFRTQGVNWDEWCKLLDKNLSQFISSFPNEVSRNIIDEQANLFVKIITKSAFRFFGVTEKSKKESKGWWNKDIKKARDDIKNANNRYKKSQSPANLNAVVKHKETLQNLIKHSTSEACKKNSEFLNSSKDSTQFWHRYHKVLGMKKDNVIEPLYDNALNTYIFKDEDISNILCNYHINKEKEDDKYDNFFKVKMKDELGNILSENVHDESYVFFDETHVKTAIRGLNKNSSPGPDRITPILIQNGCENFTKSLTILLRNSYLLGYFPKCWKQDNRIYIKKTWQNKLRLTQLIQIYFLGKIYEKIIQQEAINVLTENNFFDGKNVFAYQKNKNSSQALPPLIEQMLDAISSGKYGLAVMADLEGAFDTVWREGAIYKLHKQE